MRAVLESNRNSGILVIQGVFKSNTNNISHIHIYHRICCVNLMHSIVVTSKYFFYYTPLLSLLKKTGRGLRTIRCYVAYKMISISVLLHLGNFQEQ